MTDAGIDVDLLHRHRRRRGRIGDRHPASRDGAAAPRRADARRPPSSASTSCISSGIRTGGSRRRSTCAATSPVSSARCGRTGSMSQSPERNLDRIYAQPPRSPRGRRRRRSPRCIPTRATGGRIPSSRRKATNRGPSPQAWLGAGVDRPRRTTSTSPTAVERKIEALLSHKSQLPDPDATGDDGAGLDER